ncbi:MAG: hypothetical protein U1F98_01115 [Verrucomicrobiota bacterium]
MSLLLATAALFSASAADTNAPAGRPITSLTGRFGAGVVIGEPVGGTVKYFFNETVAIDGAIGLSLHENSTLYLQCDALWHTYDVFPVKEGKFGLYIGAGGLIRFRDNGNDNQFGIRVPLGMSYFLPDAPVEFFGEIGPALDLAPSVRGEVTGGAGVRVWF